MDFMNAQRKNFPFYYSWKKIEKLGIESQIYYLWLFALEKINQNLINKKFYESYFLKMQNVNNNNDFGMCIKNYQSSHYIVGF